MWPIHFVPKKRVCLFFFKSNLHFSLNNFWGGGWWNLSSISCHIKMTFLGLWAVFLKFVIWSCGHPVLLGLCQLVYFLGFGSVRVPLALTVLWFLFFAVHTAWVRPGCVVWPLALVEASLHVFGSAPYYPLWPGLHCWLGPLGVSGFVWVLVTTPCASAQVLVICMTVEVGAHVFLWCGTATSIQDDGN